MPMDNHTSWPTLWEEFRAFFWGIVGMLCWILGFFHGLLERALAWGRAREPKADRLVPRTELQGFRHSTMSELQGFRDSSWSELQGFRNSTTKSEPKIEQKSARSEDEGLWKSAMREDQKSVLLENKKCESAACSNSSHSQQGHHTQSIDHRSAILNSRVEGLRPAIQKRVVEAELPEAIPTLHLPEGDCGRPEAYRGGIPYNCNMGFEKHEKWYAVAVGHTPGIYRTWPEARRQTNRFPGARHKAQKSFREAKLWMERECRAGGGLIGSTHRLNCNFLGIDKAGHQVFKCEHCDEVFCSNED